MRNAITVNVKEFPYLRPMAYGARTVRVRSAESVELYGAYWDGGSRSSYHGFAGYPANALPHPLPAHGGAPQFGGTSAAVTLAPIDSLPNSLAYVVELSTFCGKRMPPRIYMHPSRFAAFAVGLSKAPELTDAERYCLALACQLKAAGRLPRWSERYSAAEYQSTRDRLHSLGMMTKQGAATPNGQNVVRGHPSI